MGYNVKIHINSIKLPNVYTQRLATKTCRVSAASLLLVR